MAKVPYPHLSPQKGKKEEIRSCIPRPMINQKTNNEKKRQRKREA
jgi:hypothetical protein